MSGVLVGELAGYKQTEVGLIPVDWEVKKLGDLTRLITKGTTPSTYGDAFTSEGINFIKIECVGSNGEFIKSKFSFITEKTHNKLARSKIEENDILFSIAGALGRLAIVSKDELPANTNQALAIIRLSSNDKIWLQYIYFFLGSYFMSNLIEKINVSSAQANLSLQNINEFKIPLPPLPEQKRIAEILTTVDDKIQNIEQQIVVAQTLKKGLMQRLFSKGTLQQKDNTPHTTFKNSPLGKIPESWEVKMLGDVCEKIQDGNYGGSYPKKNEFIEVGIPFLTSKAIGKTGELNKSKIDYISVKKHELLKKAHLKLDDVLFTNRGASTGAIGYVDHSIAHGNIGPQLTLLRVNKLVYSKFLFQLLKSDFLQSQMLSRNNGSAMTFFGIKETAKFDLIIPPIQEQKQIAEILSTADEKINNLQAKKTAFSELKKGLMQQLLTGKVRTV